MTDDVLAVDRMQLQDILRVHCAYNSETDELLITELFGNDIKLARQVRHSRALLAGIRRLDRRRL